MTDIGDKLGIVNYLKKGEIQHTCKMDNKDIGLSLLSVTNTAELRLSDHAEEQAAIHLTKLHTIRVH